MSQNDRQLSQADASGSPAIAAQLDQGLAFHRQGKLAEAERICREVLQRQPDNFDALHLLGIIALQCGRPQRAVELFRKAIGRNAGIAAAHWNLGKALLDLKHFEDALASFNTAAALMPSAALAHYNCGVALHALNRQQEALARFDQAVALNPDFAAAYNNRGGVLSDLRRHTQALADFERALALRPDFAEAHSNRAGALREFGRRDEALASCDKAIALQPGFAEPYNNRGGVLTDLKRYEEALASFDMAVALKPDYAQAHYSRGIMLYLLGRYDDALAAYDTALSLNPELVGAEGDRLLAKRRICDWRNFDGECARLIASVRQGKATTAPFPFLLVPSASAADQLQCSKLWTANVYPPAAEPASQSARAAHDRIRLGYFSADFHGHATSYLMAELFEVHDRARFDVTAFSFGPEDDGDVRQRLAASFERFIDVRNETDHAVAALARKLEIDIAVDLKGFTVDGRTGIFARRAAPIQVGYLGFPGSMGADYFDYLVADRVVIPPAERQFFSEKIVYLPDSYQVNDRKRPIAGRTPTRAQAGLPENGFVFCCFNNNHKITPAMFACWMRLLARVEGSVLWLLEDNAVAAANLLREAAARAIDPQRLVFAGRMPLPEHLARHRLADLFLDTLPYNAHTTASDALWAGLPLVTCLGDTFAGRVAASLVNAVRLPELVAATPQAYEHLALELARDPEKLAAIKRKLARHRLTTPLFDTVRFARHIEAAFMAMHERHQAGLPPEHIDLAGASKTSPH